MTAAKSNPTGKPLSGPTKGGARTYRPRKAGSKRRPRLRVAEATAKALAGEAQDVVDKRRKKAAKAAVKKTAKKAAKKTGKKRAKKTGKKGAAKKTTTAVARTERTDEPQLDLFATRNPLARGPVDLDCLTDCYALGDLVELEWEFGENREKLEVATGGKVPLLWAPACKSAFFFFGKTRRSTGDEGSAAANSGRERWQGSAPKGSYQLTAVGLLKNKVAWKKAGTAWEVTYQSNKRGKREKHVHPFDRNKVSLYVLGNLYLIRGGRLRATAKGLEG